MIAESEEGSKEKRKEGRNDEMKAPRKDAFTITVHYVLSVFIVYYSL